MPASKLHITENGTFVDVTECTTEFYEIFSIEDQMKHVETLKNPLSGTYIITNGQGSQRKTTVAELNDADPSELPGTLVYRLDVNGLEGVVSDLKKRLFKVKFGLVLPWLGILAGLVGLALVPGVLKISMLVTLGLGLLGWYGDTKKADKIKTMIKSINPYIPEKSAQLGAEGKA